MQDSHNSPLCASLGHFVGGITLAYCPHHMAWTMVVRAGDEQDDTSWRWLTVQFGPFDSDEDVLRDALAELHRVARADRAAWVALRTSREGPAAPTTEG